MSPALRVLRTPQWILRTVGALLAIAICVVASFWQYNRTDDQLAVARSAVSQLVPYDELVPTDSRSLDIGWLGHNVSVAGEVVPGARSFVRSRLSQDDEVGYLVVDGVRLDDGRVVAVLQGWVPDVESAPSLAGREVRVTGRVQPYENFYAGAPVTASDPLLTISAAGLAKQWGDHAPVDGYVTVTGTAAAPGLEVATPLVGTDPDVPFPLQNAFYSLQWLIFAGIVVFAWVRFFREDVRAERRRTADMTIVAPPGDRVSL